MQIQRIIRALCFVVFFSVGAAAMCGSILCDEIVGYYNNRLLLAAAKETSRRLESLNTDYDILLQQLRDDPNLLDRIAPVTLGIETSEDSDTVYPAVRAEELAAARRALTERTGELGAEQSPEWLERASEPRKRISLFLAGTFLILISFAFFGSKEQISRPA